MKLVTVNEINWNVMDYLKEVWGYDDPKEVDQLTKECIAENAQEGYPLDIMLLALLDMD